MPFETARLRLASRSVPAPVRRILEAAELASLPASLEAFLLDADSDGGVRKILLTFSADPADVNLFILLSPGPQKTGAVPLDAPWSGRMDAQTVPEEPARPWWCPHRHAPGVRYAYSTARLDFVEVIVTGDRRRVFVRVID